MPKFGGKQKKMPTYTTIDLHFMGIAEAIATYLLPTSEGLALIESGPHSTLPNLEKAVAALGHDPRNIKHIFLTHIHFDHAGAAWHFAKQHGATIYVHPEGARHLASPEKLYASAKRIYGDQMETLWGRMEGIAEERVQTVENGEAIHVGDKQLIAWHTPGHAVHHIAWQLDGTLFTGDVAGCKIGEGPVVPPCPPPDINLEDWEASIQSIKSLNVEQLQLTHFGTVTNVGAHLDELHERLWDWANWMRPHFQACTEPSVITPLFQQYVAQQLRAAGVSEAGIATYETANPSWMSVAGLLRYWKLKTS